MITKAIIELLLSNAEFDELVEGRVDPNVIKQDSQYPAVFVSSHRMERLKCTANNGIMEGTIEVGVYSDTYGNINAIIDCIRNTLDDYSGTVLGIGISIMRGVDTGDKFDEQDGKHVRVIEYDAFAQVN